MAKARILSAAAIFLAGWISPAPSQHLWWSASYKAGKKEKKIEKKLLLIPEMVKYRTTQTDFDLKKYIILYSHLEK